MAAAKTKSSRGKRASKGGRPPLSASAEELNAASRAQLGPDEERRPYRPRSDDASIEDPLEDWPKDEP